MKLRALVVFVGLALGSLPAWAQPAPAGTHRVTPTRLNVRSGPGTEHPVVGGLDRGALVRLAERRPDWSRLDGPPARWVATRYLEPLPVAVVGMEDVLSPTPTPAPPPAAGDARARLQRATDWLYQLQGLDPQAVRATRFDVLVTDPTRDGTDASRWPSATVSALREGGRVCLAYLSIGEAEDYRGYWRASWRAAPPAWLGPENPDWRGNYLVRYWHPGWRAVLLADDGPLARIVDAGWDGAYLDIVDGYEFWAERGEVTEAEGMRRMAALVKEVADFARARRPGFVIVPQNASALAARPDMLATIDGLALEDTFYDDDRTQAAAHTQEVLTNARAVRAAGKAVLAVDYCRAPARVNRFYDLARQAGLVPYSTVRELDRLVVNPGHAP